MERGVSKFEFLVIVVVFGILGMVLLARLTEIEADAELTAVMLTVRNIQSGLRFAQAERIMRGEESHMAELLVADPRDFLDPSKGWVVAAPEGAKGDWRFDRVRHELAYRPRLKDAFDGKDELRWRIEGTPSADGRVIGLRLARIEGVDR